ncbi:hypothetical protein [Rhizobium leguminosarum]
MNRDTQADVLVSSRRRCAICFGLHRDAEPKAGQIAHLDKKNSNNALDNLAFLCFEHHNEYDSTMSQSKGLQMQEVKRYRQELLAALGDALEQKVHFGTVTIPSADPYAGLYVRLSSGESPSEISLTPLPDTMDGLLRYYVHGLAYHGVSREYGPNMGELDFVGIMYESDEFDYMRPTYKDGVTAISRLRWLDTDILEVKEQDILGQYGMSVTFEGVYRRKR